MATARALVEIDAGRPVGALRAYRLAFGSLRSLFVALMIAVVAVLLLAGSVVLIPIAVWLAVRWALIAPAIELEGLSGFEALRRSGRLVRRKWLKVGSLTILGAAIAFVTGSLAGVLLILVTDAPLATADVVAGIVYAVTLPFVALTTAYVYFDTRVRDELAGPVVDRAVCGDRARGRSRYTPVCAGRRPDLTALTKASKSRSFWSAYSAAKSAIALSNALPLPRYDAIAIRSPQRACARASVAPHSRA